MSDSTDHVGFTAPDPADLAPLFPGYEIQGLIATGGMGAVYSAVQKSLDRTVALKILPVEFSKDAAFRIGFETEAKAMARLNHPNLIGVYDFGEVNDMLYIIMEFVAGQSVYHAAYGKVLDQAEAVRLVLGVTGGLAHAHENGILHRDIKPSNILLDLNAQPKIGDFGLARPVEHKISEGEEIFGTPHYTAPEVVNAPHTVDHRADIFSVGVLLHELLTGRLPANDPRPASTIVSCDPRLDGIIKRATQPLAAARYSSAAEMARDLQAVATTLAQKMARPGVGPVAAPRPVTRRPSAKRVAKKDSGATPVILIVVALAAAAAAYLLFSKPPEEKKAPSSGVVVVPTAPKETPVSTDIPPARETTDIPPVTPKPQPDATAGPTTSDGTAFGSETPPVVADGQTDPAVTPGGAPPMVEEGLAPKSDVAGFLTKARKIMQDKAKVEISKYQSSLRQNLSSYERDLLRQSKKPKTANLETVLSSTLTLWKAANRIPTRVPSALSELPEIENLHAAYTTRQTGIDDTFNQSIGSLSALYITGLEKQIERMKTENDPGAVKLLEEEIKATKDEPDHFRDLMVPPVKDPGSDSSDSPESPEE